MGTIPPYLGASFHKCDFQVHSVRDIAWEGPFDPITQRDQFATALVADCRRKGLNAIAITDHHDLCLWTFVRDAAKAETRSDGSPYGPEEQIIIFPGVELTLSSPPCQALLLFDPDIAESVLNHIWGVLNVIPNNPAQPQTTVTQALGADRNIASITSGLASLRTNPEETNPNKFKFLEGHFIFLPHVSPDGHQSILRNNFQGFYSDSPFHGGYLEKRLYSALHPGRRNILEGRDLAWGNKAIGVFQTSDCRKAAVASDGVTVNFVDLGNWPTWVKWAHPCTEALRQACLARDSRIFHSEPTFPLLQVIGVRVSDSVFLGPVELGLSPQLNSFIGGRGTGKSSLLEYIRWALCDDPSLTGADESELPNFEKRRKALIDQTLKPKGASVTVFYKRNEVIYSIERSVNTKDDSCTVVDGEGNAEVMRAAQIRQQFPILSYAQKQLSSVGTLPDEIHRLITGPVKDQLETIEKNIETEILPALKQQRLNQRRLKDMDAQLTAVQSANKNRREQIKALQSQLQALTPEQQKTIDGHSSFLELGQWKRRAEEMPSELVKLLADVRSKILSLQELIPPDTLLSSQQMGQVANAANRLKTNILAALNQQIANASGENWLTADERVSLQAIQTALDTHTQSYETCIAENAKSQKQLGEIQNLNKQLSDTEGAQVVLESERATLNAELTKAGQTPWEAFQAALKKRGDILEEQCTKIFEQARHGFRPLLRRLGNERNIRGAISEIIEGRSVRESELKTSELTSIIVSSEDPAAKWQQIIAELDSLVTGRDSSTLPETPILNSAGFTSANLDSLRRGLSQETIEKNRFFNIPDSIEFEFKRGQKPDGTDNYIPFLSASPGQQATCLLETLLAQDGAPLLIDQPEEDLDNEQIQSVSERISSTKSLRQLVFVSHNANIVVNGDSELVACFRYADNNDNTTGLISPVGSIDYEPVRETITTVMEGGKKAFELRREKYGF